MSNFWDRVARIGDDVERERLARATDEHEWAKRRVFNAFREAFGDEIEIVEAFQRSGTWDGSWYLDEGVTFIYRGQRLEALWRCQSSIFSGTSSMQGWEIRYKHLLGNVSKHTFWGSENYQTGYITYNIADLYLACRKVTGIK